MTFINFDGHLGGHFEFYSEVNRDHTHFLRWILETHFPYLTPYQIFKTENLFPDSFFLLLYMVLIKLIIDLEHDPQKRPYH